MKNIIKNTALLLTIFLSFLLGSNVNAQENIQELKFATYFTGIGCPHCTVASPFIKNLIDQNHEL